uniref:Uncharacterized protein n=1 Tax=Strigamia maritima TaxID=126957 RepID=T1JKC3_STRMM
MVEKIDEKFCCIASWGGRRGMFKNNLAGDIGLAWFVCRRHHRVRSRGYVQIYASAGMPLININDEREVNTLITLTSVNQYCSWVVPKTTLCFASGSK